MELFEFASSWKNKKQKLQVDGGISCLAAKQLSSVQAAACFTQPCHILSLKFIVPIFSYSVKHLSWPMECILIFTLHLMPDVLRTLEE